MVTTHWLPVSLSDDGRKTACGIDVYDHPHLEWRTQQNEADCRRCAVARWWNCAWCLRKLTRGTVFTHKCGGE